MGIEYASYRSATPKHLRVTIDEYLDREKSGELKHEYIDGYVYAMVGGTLAHNIITRNIARLLDEAVRGRLCRVFTSDVRIRTINAFYYPDVVVDCQSTALDVDFITTPKLVVEVLSPSTERTDTVEKRAAYQSLESLQEYVLVSPDKREIQVYRRVGEDWPLETYAEADTVRFESVDLKTRGRTVTNLASG